MIHLSRSGLFFKVNQSYSLLVKMIQEPVDVGASRLYAQAALDLPKLTIEDSTTLSIGDTTYTFSVGWDSSYKDRMTLST